jgi:hypothetical protein
MNQKITFFALALTVVGVISYADLTSKPASTPTGGYAGEPALSRTCASSGCHSGSTIIDSSQFSLKMASALSGLSGASDLSSSTTFMPDSTYYMSMQLTGTANRYGFSLSSLTSANAQAGSFTVTSSTTTAIVAGASGITNMSHKNANTTKSWIWKWTAPSSTNAVNFYFAGMLANGNNTESGDIVYKSAISIMGQAPNAINEISAINALNVYPTQTMSDISLNVDAKESGDAVILLVNMTGEVVRELYNGKLNLGENNMRFNIADLSIGNYIMSLKSAKGSSVARHIIKF